MVPQVIVHQIPILKLLLSVTDIQEKKEMKKASEMNMMLFFLNQPTPITLHTAVGDLPADTKVLTGDGLDPIIFFLLAAGGGLGGGNGESGNIMSNMLPLLILPALLKKP